MHSYDKGVLLDLERGATARRGELPGLIP